MGQRETPIEEYLVQEVAKAGGVAEKFKSPQKKNVPDRLVSWPSAIAEFVELKAEGEPPNAGQTRDHNRRRKMGFEVHVIDSKKGVDDYIWLSKRCGFAK